MAMPILVPALAAGAMLVAIAADGVPTFDARPGCQAAADASTEANRNIDSCVASERQARDALLKQWQNFPARDRAECVSLTSMGGPPSYIEVLTCLEMARDARALHLDQDSTGVASKPEARRKKMSTGAKP
jgi:hypothetical protein